MPKDSLFEGLIGGILVGLLGIASGVFAIPAPLLIPSATPTWNWEVRVVKVLPL
jgi:hypothetical protein